MFKKSAKAANNKDNKETNPSPNQDLPVTIPTTSPVSSYQVKVREDTIPVIVVNGVYFPTQRLRFKLNDPNMNFCKVPNMVNSNF